MRAPCAARHRGCGNGLQPAKPNLCKGATNMKSNDGTTQAQTPRGVFHIQSEKDWALAMEALADTDPGTYRLVLQSPFHSLRDISESLSRLPGSILIDLDMSAATGVTSIEYWAFAGCTAHSSVSIPAGVTSIGWGHSKAAPPSKKSPSLPASPQSEGAHSKAAPPSSPSPSPPASPQSEEYIRDIIGYETAFNLRTHGAGGGNDSLEQQR